MDASQQVDTYAEKLIRLIKERIDLIVENPEAGKPTNHLETREATMGNFSIYYKLTEKNIFITAFWDNHQNPGKLARLIK
ncbi:type II toxin-antitoxin system RelE/ParE family toxin [Flavobacterium sp.]|uniref:type II toxin-antitoxin system RelE/ParE family toxin n=1 Tax=Flavobacterium sp. TaxID=239 RepID=UPI0025B88E7D|nr:type II toxin-antitoxin system RelE/ParE family toxin [Flavobacterium sp.]